MAFLVGFRVGSGRCGWGWPLGLVLMPLVLIALVPPSKAGATNDTAMLERGRELFATQCAICHGSAGMGDGDAAYLLSPRPRNFSSATFRLVSTSDGIPTDEDLLNTLRNGMPGSAMPPWGHLASSDLDALVLTIRDFVIQGKLAELLSDEPDLDPDEALEEVLDEFGTPTDTADVPAPPPGDRIDLDHGQELYSRNCTHCHGDDGRGEVSQAMFDGEGYPITARDFTVGIFKGGSKGVDIARRIWLGMPGSPMPATPYAQDDLWSLVRYVQGLIKPGAQEQVVQSPKVLTARRVASTLGDDPDAAVWASAEGTWLSLMPLWWRNDRVEGVSVQALHDGRTLALRVTWDDATKDDALIHQRDFGDALALELSVDSDPPFFGMGASRNPVSIWQWKAGWQRDLIDPLTMADAFPNKPRGQLAQMGAPQDKIFMTGEAAGNPLSQGGRPMAVENLSATGHGTLRSLPRVDVVADGLGRWADRRWSVVLLRDMWKPAPDGVLPEPGARFSAAFAVWDGSAGDRNGSKSVTIWHKLVVED